MARKKVIYWSGFIAALTFFGFMGLWGGGSIGQAQVTGPPPGCVNVKLEGKAGAGVDCGGAYIKLNELPSGYGWYTALCIRRN